MKELRRVFVTGGSGLVGSALVPALVASGWSVRALIHERPVPKSESIKADITQSSELRPHLASCSLIIHAAGYVSEEFEHCQRVHVEGTRALCEAALAAGVASFVHLSTTAVYRRGELDNVDETAPTARDNPYIDAKLEAEDIVRSLLGDRATIIRPVVVYDSVPCTFSRLVEEVVRYSEIPDHPDVPLELVHTQDLARAIVAAANGKGKGGCYHIASSPRCSFRGLVEMAAQQLGVDLRWHKGNGEGISQLVLEAATVARSLSCQRAVNDLDYAPSTDWHTELRRAFELGRSDR